MHKHCQSLILDAVEFFSGYDTIFGLNALYFNFEPSDLSKSRIVKLCGAVSHPTYLILLENLYTSILVVYNINKHGSHLK